MPANRLAKHLRVPGQARDETGYLLTHLSVFRHAASNHADATQFLPVLAPSDPVNFTAQEVFPFLDAPMSLFYGHVTFVRHVLEICFHSLFKVCPTIVVHANIIGTGAGLRTAVIFFYLSNEGVTILENAALLDLLIPEKLKSILVQLRDGEDEELNN